MNVCRPIQFGVPRDKGGATPLLACLLLSAATGPLAALDHSQQNHLFRELTERGVGLAEGRNTAMPKPTLPDGLDAAAQRKIVETLASDAGIDFDEFTRNSVVARFVQRLDDVQPPLADGSIRRLDVWFVVHGDLDKLSDKSFLDRMGASSGKEGGGKPIEASELAKRGIAFSEADAKSIAFGHLTAKVMNRVELRMTGQSQFSRNAESVVVASKIDDKFLGDADYPNQWRHLDEGDAKPVAYRGGGYYLKVTPLHEPKGAMLVESHSLFVEPTAWFGGANTLRSKLPAVVESQVRAFRRELLK